MRDKIFNWIEEKKGIDELIEYLKLPSITDNKTDVKASSVHFQRLLDKAGFDTRFYPTSGNDVLYAERIVGEGPSILIYGHLDVQPEGDLDLWNSDPFEPLIMDNKIFCRGSADNKGQHFAHLLAFRYLQEFHSEVFDKVNVKFILDGDEEKGSFSIPEVIKENAKMLQSDFIYVSDGPSLSHDTPSLVCSVRGILDFQLKVKNNSNDLHSGNFGGLARSSTRDLIALLDSMIDPNGRVLVEGFYDEVQEPLQTEKDAIENLSEFYDKLLSEITPAPTHSNFTNPQQVAFQPTLNINGIKAGGVENKRRTIIPSEAIASIDCRLVPNQEPDVIKSKLEKHISKVSKEMGINYTIEFGHSMDPIRSSIESKYIDIIRDSLKVGFAKEPIIVPRLGGSLPIYLFPKYLDAPVFVVPLSTPDSRNHGPNENMDLNYFRSGVASTAQLLINLSNL